MRKCKNIVVTVFFPLLFSEDFSTRSSQPEESMLGVCGGSDYGAGSAVSSVLDG